MIELLWPAAVAGILVALVAGPLGTLVVWQRLAYFGDTLAHSALLGAALGLWLHIGVWWSTAVVCAVLAILLVALQRYSNLASDSLLGILSHSALALGVLALGLIPSVRIDLNSYLFGDLLAVMPRDVVVIAGVTLAVGAVLVWLWDRLLAITVHAELAAVEGLPVTALRMTQMVLMALLVAVAMKVVGALLVTALLIIPASSAQAWARSPEQMALLAAGAGAVSVIGGLLLAVAADLPVGPAIVVAAAMLFAVSRLTARRREY